MIRAIRICRDIYHEQPQASQIAKELFPGDHIQTDAELEMAIREQGHTRSHPVGTCAMGVGTQAVVDAQLRVVGMNGLRVVDASVLPDELGGNNHIPVVMVAEKAADMICSRVS